MLAQTREIAALADLPFPPDRHRLAFAVPR